MNEQQRIVYMQAQIASALIEMEGMKAENMSRSHNGEAMAYGEGEFFALIDKHMLGHNATLTELWGER